MVVDQLVNIQLLGGFSVAAGSRALIDQAWPRRKATALVKLLALQPDRRLHRDQILDLLWPDLTPAAAANNLHKAAHYLRAPFVDVGCAPIAEATGTGFALTRDVVVDIDQFRSLAATARAGSTDLASYARALEAYRGDLLPDDLYESWTEPHRADLAALFAQISIETARLYELRGSWDDALRVLAPLRHDLRWIEDVGRALMRVYACSGQAAAAAEEYRRCERVLADELGVAPTAETRALRDQIAAGALQTQATRRPHAPLEPLFGRTHEVARLRDAFDNACGGHGGIVVLTGEPGIGKTRLAQELVAIARLREAHVLWGRCDLAGGAPAFWPWMQALGDFVHDQSGGSGASSAGQRETLASLIPSLPSSGDRQSGDGRRRLFDAVEAFLKQAAATRPLLLVLDDLHDADEASLQLLRHVARGVNDCPILIVVSLRDSEPVTSGALQQVLAELAREGMRARLTLSGLGARDIGLLLTAATGYEPSDASVHALLRGSGGNPFFVSECAQLLVEGSVGGALPEAGQLHVPPSVRDVVLQRIAALSDAARAALRIAAVIGEEFDRGLLGRACGLAPDVLLDALGELQTARLILQQQDEASWMFGHGLVRKALYDDMRPATRAAMHGTIAEAIEAITGGEQRYAQLAHHFGSAAQGGGDPSKAIAYAIKAGEADLAVFAWERAIAHWIAAARFMDDHGGDREELAALLERTETIIFSSGGDYAVGLDCLRRALPIREVLGQHERVAQINSRLGRALSTHIGDPRYGKYMDLRSALDHYQRAAPVFAEGPPRPAKAYFYAAMATTAFNAVRIPEGLEAAAHAHAVAEALDMPEIRASALLMQGLLSKASGSLCDAARTLDEAYKIADQENIPSLVYYAVTSLGDWMEGFVAGGGDLFERELAKPRFADAGMFRSGLMEDLASALCISGMLDRARNVVPSAAGGNQLFAFWEGDWEAAEHSWSEGYGVLVQAGARSAYTNRGHQLAELFRVRGEYGRAEQMRLAELEVALGGGSLLIEYRCRAELALLYAETGRFDDAHAQLGRLEAFEHCDRWGRKHARAELARALCGATYDTGKDTMLSQVATRFRTLGLPWDEAETLVQWSRLLQRSGELKDAKTRSEEAIAIYRAIGAGSGWIVRARATD